MLYFANSPDPVFTAILHAALEGMHGTFETLADPEWGSEPSTEGFQGQRILKYPPADALEDE
jgi:hypothetical protein